MLLADFHFECCCVVFCCAVRSILFHIQSIVAGYICPLSQLSAFDMTIGSEANKAQPA